MSNDKITLSSFPSTRTEALTMLYLEKQDLSHISPEELVEKYLEIEGKINQTFSKHSKKAFS
ncbi:hypothetical protein BVF91_05985 [Thermoanaerobacterium sp. PSU-2]|uniref:hypothetical protein n=1 Tax=Thermoanaerobacterium sp. PSU-2 TaxID=1930849 RepID=UPI000A14BEF2|nr:hypothetical protein [Thermoanaerobacterium sp. PSU-2]ORX23379.1 hypothetical protein BVF91_05985 [Thermoanaerobacterium sp. PSU-2]